MELYIQIENGQPINHPAFGDNLRQAFGEIPSNWEPFERIERPVPGVYQILESDQPTYQKVGEKWTDIWSLRDMTAAEKAAKQQATIDAFNNRPQAENWSAWTLDEATCTMQPPIPRPEPDEAKLTQGIMTFWCGADNNWKDAPAKPEGQYIFDFVQWTWVPVNG